MSIKINESRFLTQIKFFFPCPFIVCLFVSLFAFLDFFNVPFLSLPFNFRKYQVPLSTIKS